MLTRTSGGHVGQRADLHTQQQPLQQQQNDALKISFQARQQQQQCSQETCLERAAADDWSIACRHGMKLWVTCLELTLATF